MSTEVDHFVFFCVPAWGHNQNLVPMAIKFIETNEKPSVVTILAAHTIFGRLQTHAPKYLNKCDENVKNSVRIIAIDNDGMFENMPKIEGDFLQAYQTLHESKPLKCSLSNTVYPVLPPPKTVVLDFFAYRALLGLRQINPKAKVFTWQSGSMAAMTRFSGPKELGGGGDKLAQAEEEAIRTGRSLMEVAEEAFARCDGSVFQVPGLPPMYDHEFFPQEFPFVKGISLVVSSTYRCMLESDGVIVQSDHAYEGETLKAYSNWLQKERNIDLYALTFPPNPDQVKATPEDEEIQSFLDSTLKRFGEKSMFFISFGSVMWTVQPEKIWKILEVLMNEGVPFIFAYSSPFCQVPLELLENIKASGMGLATPWAPQHTILNHPALGWFITHGGHNSTMEALYSGIPMIYAPISGDQPANAAKGSHVLNIGYELFETRNGEHGTKPIHRHGPDAVPIEGTVESVEKEFRGVLAKARGEDGAVRRANAVKVSQVLQTGWNQDGVCTNELRRLLGV